MLFSSRYSASLKPGSIACTKYWLVCWNTGSSSPSKRSASRCKSFCATVRSSLSPLSFAISSSISGTSSLIRSIYPSSIYPLYIFTAALCLAKASSYFSWFLSAASCCIKVLFSWMISHCSCSAATFSSYSAWLADKRGPISSISAARAVTSW